MKNEPTGPLGESWRAWLALLIGCLAISAQSASSLAVAVLMKPILGEMHWDRAEFASAMTLRMFLMTACMPFVGGLTDRIGARGVLAGGAVVVGLGSMAIASVQSLPQLFPVMAFIGPGQAGIGAVAASALVLRLFKHRRGLAVGILNGGDNLITATIPLSTAALLASSGWRSAITTLGAAYLVLALFIWIVLRPREGGEEADTTAVRRRGIDSWRLLPWRDARLWLLLGSYTLVYAFITSVQLHIHAFQTDSGLTPEQASSIMSTQLLAGAFGSPIFGWAAERFSIRGTLALVLGGLTACSVALWTLHGLQPFLVWAVIYGLINSGVVALLALVLDEMYGAEHIGRLMGLAMIFCMGATMLGNLFSATMFDRYHSYNLVWQSYTGLMCLSLIPVIALWRARLPANAHPFVP